MFSLHAYINKAISKITRSFIERRIRRCRHRLGDGQDVELHLTLADLYEELGDSSLALESYRTAVSKLVGQKDSVDTETSNQLIAICKKILMLAPLDEDIAEKLGQEYQRRGMIYRAVSLYTVFAERFTQRNNYHRALEYYQRVLEIEPGSITTRQMRAYLHCHLRQYLQGAQEYLHIGNMYFEHQQFEGALEYYQYASGLDPENVEIQDKLRLAQQILEGTVQITSPGQHNMATLEQLHHELFRQYENEANLSEGFQRSLREIALLLQDQEEEIQQLACLA